MISDILFAAVTQIRSELMEQARYVEQERARGRDIHTDPAQLSAISTVVDDMERLAGRLLTSTVGPFVDVRQ